MLKALAIVLTVPAFGIITSTWILSDINADFGAEGLLSVQEICALPEAQGDRDIGAACSEISHIEFLGKASVFSAVAGVVLLALFWVGSGIAGSDRKRIANVFPLLTRLTIAVLSALVLVHGAILTYGAYIGESYAIERVHLVLIGGIALGALVAAFSLIGAAASLSKKLRSNVVGTYVSEQQCPKLYEFVRGLARKLESMPPSNIVVGLEPNFFVTNADVHTLEDNRQLAGETLYVSAPLSRLMTREEFAAVIGHELGHFRGEDTAYSMRFAPVYAGMARAIAAVDTSSNEGLSGLAKLPALAVLSYMYEVFTRNVNLVNRERELLADQAGSEASNPRALSSALAKVSLYSSLWPRAQQQNIDRLSQGKLTRNLSTVFHDSAKFDVEHEKFDDLLGHILERRIAHPTDTHPTLHERLSALGIEASRLNQSDILPPDESAIELIDNYAEFEEKLTLFEHRLMVALGRVVVPKQSDEGPNHALSIIYSMAAAMVSADGSINPKEIAIAEAIGMRLLPNFDSVDFRATCSAPTIPKFGDLVDVLKDVLEEETKRQIHSYLQEVAKADGAISSEEQALLDELAQKFRINNT